MAAPYVAAEAAILLAQGRGVDETINLIVGTATNPTGHPQLGAGVINVAAAVTGPPAESPPAQSVPASPNQATSAPVAAEPLNPVTPTDIAVPASTGAAAALAPTDEETSALGSTQLALVGIVAVLVVVALTALIVLISNSRRRRARNGAWPDRR